MNIPSDSKKYPKSTLSDDAKVEPTYAVGP